VCFQRERTPLHEACERGQLQFVAELLAAGSDPRLADVEGNTPLHLAVQACHSDVVQALVSLDDDPLHMQNVACWRDPVLVSAPMFWRISSCGLCCSLV
jgi:ankyrin repeat protein